MKIQLQPSTSRTLSSALVAGAVLLALAGCSDSEVKLLGSARGYLEKGDQNAAIIQLKTTLQKFPQSAEARLLMGRALLDMGDAVGAEVELTKALDQGVAPDQVVPLLASALIGQGQGKKLIERYGQTTLVDPKAGSALAAALASAHMTLGRKQEGNQALDKALQLDNDNGRALLLRAQLTAAEGKLDDAMAQTDAMIARSIEKPAALVLKGSLHVALEKNAEGLAKARRSFEAAVQAKPNYVSAHTALMALAQQEQNSAELRSRWEAFQKVAPRHPTVLLMEADYALRDGKLDRAREVTDLMLKAAGGDARVQLLAARVAERANNTVQAEVHAARAVQLAPRWPEARRVLAQNQMRTGQVKRALETLQPLLEGERPDAETLALAGQAMLQDGQADKAGAMLRRASEMKPQDLRLKTMNTVAQLGRGRDGEVMLELESIASNDAGNTADLVLISARMQQRDFDGASRAAASLRKKQPDNPLPAHIEGQVRLAKGDRSSARQAFESALSIKGDYLPSAMALSMLDLSEGKNDKARSHFERVLKVDPKSAQAHLAIAELKARDGATPAEVRAILEAAVKAVPDSPALRVTLVNHLLGASKDKRAALAAAQDANTAVVDQPEVIDALGRAQLANDAKEQAGTTFRRLVQLQPENLAFQVRLADSQSATGDYSDAVRTLRKALESKPDFLPAQQKLLANLVALNRTADAYAAAKDVQKQRPQDPTGWIFEGDVAMQAKQLDTAVAAYRTALAKTRSTQTVTKLHGALALHNRSAEASELAASWLKTSPRDITFIGYLADLAINRQAWPEAESLLRDFLKVEPNNAVIMNNLAYALVSQRKAGALETAEKANALLPETPVIMDTLAMALAANRQFPKAIEVQRAAVEKSNGDYSLRLNLAKIYVESGDKPAARKELEQLVALGVKFPQQTVVSQMLKSL